jgi:hypothetical protein
MNDKSPPYEILIMLASLVIVGLVLYYSMFEQLTQGL